MKINKYRVYDNEDKTFFYFTLQDCVNKEVFLFKDMCFEQYTGESDKNKKEVYENDIMKRTMHYVDIMSENFDSCEEVEIGIVEFVNGRYIVNCKDIQQIFNLYEFCFKGEVIGNTHE